MELFRIETVIQRDQGITVAAASHVLRFEPRDEIASLPVDDHQRLAFHCRCVTGRILVGIVVDCISQILGDLCQRIVCDWRGDAHAIGQASKPKLPDVSGLRRAAQRGQGGGRRSLVDFRSPDRCQHQIRLKVASITVYYEQRVALRHSRESSRRRLVHQCRESYGNRRKVHIGYQMGKLACCPTNRQLQRPACADNRNVVQRYAFRRGYLRIHLDGPRDPYDRDDFR